jgi:uncharacterized membrane protein
MAKDKSQGGDKKKEQEPKKQIPKIGMPESHAAARPQGPPRMVGQQAPQVIVKQMAVPEVRIYSKTTPKKSTIGTKASDMITRWGGSWYFITGFFVFLLFWMILNLYLITQVFDPYPFILLNLVLSCLAAIQAPIILMSQNRAADRDRSKAERDYAVNRKSEREVEMIKKDLDFIKKRLAEINARIR